ncbi:hypothetical protein [Algoriphagus mannitolivorans]|uniref:hypothetical protein n=1 Tax=Algoriphagus mannitolivorans TaxID=226504 RepID=UPI0004088209|nr:hypothetical protein [Algoriphagus mannitolivorans]
MKIIHILWITFLIPFLSVDSNRDQSIENWGNDSPTVRESTVDIQVKVGEKLFVFGKAQGTLDNVKIGMHLLNFAQNPTIAGVNADLNQVTWKKLKNGAIQIQSYYKPWPNILTWLVLPDGKLKMEAIATESYQHSLANLGLGFDFPEEELKKLELNDQQLAFPDALTEAKFFKNVSFEFANAKLNIQSELSDLAFNSNFSNKGSKDADFVISFPEDIHTQSTPSAPGVTFGVANRNSVEPMTKMVLWFDFQ